MRYAAGAMVGWYGAQAPGAIKQALKRYKKFKRVSRSGGRHNCHSRVSGNPTCSWTANSNWMPAFAGMTSTSDVELHHHRHMVEPSASRAFS